MKHIKLFEDVWETLNFRKLNNDIKYFVTDLKDEGFKILAYDNETDSLDEYDYAISLYSKDNFKLDYIKDNLDTIASYK
jgi:tRNA G18 (ribose-2'-O)-methylase SpoU